MRAFSPYFPALVLWILSTAAPADFRQDATDAMDAIPYAQDPAVFNRITTFLVESDATEDAWRLFFGDYFDNRNYPVNMPDFWTATARAYPSMNARWPRFALMSATAALAARWDRAELPPERLPELQAILRGLADVAAVADPALGTAFFELWETFGDERPLPVAPALESTSPERVAAAMQAVLLFASFAGDPKAVVQAVSLPERTARFLGEFGFFLFDAGALTPQQLASLESLADAVPRGAYNIVALTVPAALGFDPATGGFFSPGALVPIDPVAMDVLTNPQEFIPRVGQPVAPLFTARAARQFMRAIQAHEFSRRPELLWRRNALLANAGTQRERYLRQTVPPAVYQAQPDELLPDLAFLYVVDARALFREALDLLSIDQTEAMDQFLLLVDMLSGGSNTAPLWRTALDGAVYTTPAALARTQVLRVAPPGPARYDVTTTIPVQLHPITSIAFGGRSWEFRLNNRGGAADLIERF